MIVKDSLDLGLDFINENLKEISADKMGLYYTDFEDFVYSTQEDMNTYLKNKDTYWYLVSKYVPLKISLNMSEDNILSAHLSEENFNLKPLQHFEFTIKDILSFSVEDVELLLKEYTKLYN